MADITSNLLAHWKLDETSGTTLADSSWNGYSLTMANSPTLGGTTLGGVLGTNVAFNGTNQRATRSSTAALRNVAAGTVAFWFNPTSTAAGKWAFTLTGGTNQNRASVQLIAGGALRFWGRAGDAEAAQSLLTSSSTVTAGTWAHVVGVWNYTSDTIACYINGSLLSSASVSFTASATSDTNATTIAIASDGASDYLACSFDDVRIYSRALSADDALALYNLKNLRPAAILQPLLCA